MIKEILLAIVLGALLGFGATNTLVAIQKSKPTKTTSSSPTVTPNISLPAPTKSDLVPTPPDQNQVPLNIDQPENEDVFTNSKITLQGSTLKGNTIIIRTPLKSYTTQANSDGGFTQEIELDAGVNLITITSITDEGDQTDSQLTLTYSTTKF